MFGQIKKNGNFSFNFFHFSWHIIWLVCRVVMLFFYWRKDLSSVNFSDTSNMLVKSTEKFLEAFEKKVLLKNKVFQNILLTTFWASFFKHLNFFHFSWHIIWLVGRVVIIFYWHKYLSSVNFSNTSSMLVKST